MQAFQLVRGLYDIEIQERILAEAANRELKLADIIKLAEAVESGKRSSGVLSKSAGLNRLSQRVEKQGKKCSYCGGTWHEGAKWKQNCRGFSNTSTTSSWQNRLQKRF